MTTKDLAALIGKSGTITLDTLCVKVKIVDTRHNYGRMDLKVTPVHGSGDKWVNADKVTLLEAK